jgi:hypothetical protein
MMMAAGSPLRFFGISLTRVSSERKKRGKRVFGEKSSSREEE